jgi:hypothetical protein
MGEMRRSGRRCRLLVVWVMLIAACDDGEPASGPEAATLGDGPAQSDSTVASAPNIETMTTPSSIGATTDAAVATAAAASDVAAQRARWEAAGIDSYHFTVTWTSANAFVGDYRVTVIDGQPRRVVRSDGLEIDPDEMAGERPVTIDEVFDVIEDMLSAETFTATYDQVLGYPVDVSVDEFAGVVDDEFRIRISDFGLDPEVPAVTAD